MDQYADDLFFAGAFAVLLSPPRKIEPVGVSVFR